MILPVAVCALPAPAPNAPRTVQHAEYIHEILGHAGLCCEAVAFADLAACLAQGTTRLLVTVGERPFEDALRNQLTRWVRDEGGTWISVGGLCGMTDLLGADYAPAAYALWAGSLRSLGEGFLDAGDSGHRIVADLPIPLHFFGGVAAQERPGTHVLARTRDAHHRPTVLPALIENRAGTGRTLLIAPDVTGTVVRILQGAAVTRDGVPAPDGTAPVSDGVLKSDDGQALDWLLDREPVPGVPGLSAFLQPVADQWCGLLLRAIFDAAERSGLALPVLWYHPDGHEAIGHISHDTDGNDPARARRLLDVLERAGIRSTWCVILPGYDRELVEAIRSAGHELATHFDAMTDGCPWGETFFDAQWRQLREMFGSDDVPVTNKNHYLRWQGDTELWDWCVARGLLLDQSKGASKTGEAGFNFGTCHLYRPVTFDGEVLPVWEMTTPTQDLLVFAPTEIVPPLLDAVKRQYGILHLLFHPAHVDKPGVAESLLNAVRAGQTAGLAWRTGREIVLWEAARRQARWSAGNDGEAVLATPAALPGATLLTLATGPAADAPTVVNRWGFRFQSVVRDLTAGETTRIQTKEG